MFLKPAVSCGFPYRLQKQAWDIRTWIDWTKRKSESSRFHSVDDAADWRRRRRLRPWSRPEQTVMSSELSASAQYCCGFQSAESWQTGYWVPDGLWLTSWKYWRPTALHTPSAIEMKLREGDEWRRCEKKGEARSFSAVQNTSWCVCLEAFGGWSYPAWRARV